MKNLTSNYWCKRQNGEFPQEEEGYAAQGAGEVGSELQNHFGNV